MASLVRVAIVSGRFSLRESFDVVSTGRYLERYKEGQWEEDTGYEFMKAESIMRQ